MRLAQFTSGRAEFGLLQWVHKAIEACDGLEAGWLVTGTHLAPEFGETVREIEKAGGEIWRRTPVQGLGGSSQNLCAFAGRLLEDLGHYAAETRPDAIVLVGDRLETLAAAIAAYTTRIPIVHIHGGELSRGALDDGYRHTITKLAALHFAAAEPYRDRIIQMGEPAERAFCVGALANDAIAAIPAVSRQDVVTEIGQEIGSPFLLVTLHPETIDESDPAEHVEAVARALDALEDFTAVWTFSNADAGGHRLNACLEALPQRFGGRVIVRPSLGHRLYISAMRICDLVLGNSSSGIIEAPLVGVPSVNIGRRQDLRLRSESIIDCSFDSGEIVDAIRRGLDPAFRERARQGRSPYHGQETGKAIVRHIAALLPDLPSGKDFQDLAVAGGGHG